MNASIATRVLRGAALRDHLLSQVSRVLPTLRQQPCVAIVQVGNNPASTAYIRQKITTCNKIGIKTEHIHLPATSTEAELHATLELLVSDPQITAVIPQLPLPPQWDTDAALNTIPALKDIDGLTLANQNKRLARDPTALAAATPLGVMRLLQHEKIPIENNTIAVIGRGRVVGAPLRQMLATAGAKVIGIDKETPNPRQLSKQAAVVCCAAGVPHLVDETWIAPGATVIDIGLTRLEDRLVGDANLDKLMGVARLVSASPGGVGPLTVASLITNIIDAACLQQNLSRPTWSV